MCCQHGALFRSAGFSFSIVQFQRHPSTNNGWCDLILEHHVQEALEEDLEDLIITSVLQQLYEGFHQVNIH